MDTVTLVISVPDLYPAIRTSAMPLSEAAVMVAEINESGSFIGARATAYIGAPPAPVPATPQPQTRNRRESDYQPLVRSGSWVTAPRKVRASSTRWHGESNGNRWERNVIEGWAR